jgi:putative DNA primase/helicase
MSKEWEGKGRYLFVVDNAEIAEAIFAHGCNALLIRDNSELREMVNMLEGCDMYANNVFTILCCSMKVNKLVANAIGNTRAITGGAYRLYGQKKLYYQLHADEIGERIDLFIKSVEGNSEGNSESGNAETELARNPVTGLIVASSKDNPYKSIAKYIIDKYDIVSIDDEICIKSVREDIAANRIYTLYTPAVHDRIMMDELHNSSSSYRKEMFMYVSNFAPVHERTKNCIAFKNCVYSMGEGNIKEYTDDMYFTSYIPHNFVTGNIDNEYCDFAEAFLNSVACGDEEIVKLLYEVIAYSLIEGNPRQKTFFIYGNGGNGKGVFFKLLEAVMGKNNVAYRTWADLTTGTGRFGIADKKLVLCNDIDNIYLKEVQALKTLTACEPQSVKQLYRDEFTMIFKGKIISSGNSVPRVNDVSGGWSRRLVIIPFNGDFRRNPDIYLADKLTREQCIEYVIVRAVFMLDRLMSNGFTKPKAAAEVLREYHLENNPVLQFLDENCDMFRGEENAKTIENIYSTTYLNFCKDNGYKPLTKIGFAKRVNAAGMKWRYMTGTNKKIYYIPK